MSITTVTKYPGTINAAASWADFTVARLGADDSSSATCTVASHSATGTGKASGFGFAIPAGVTITEVTLASDIGMSATYPSDWYVILYINDSEQARVGRLNGESKTLTGEFLAAATVTALNSSTALRVEAYAVNVETSSRLASVDYISITVKYYTPATVTTAAVTDITQDTATCGGNATDDGSGTISAKGVCWNNSGSPTIADSFTSDGSGTGAFVSSLTGIFASSHCYVRAYATTEDGTVYGPEVEFDTLASASRSLVARPFTTRAAAAEFVSRQGTGLIDWWYEDDVVRAELRPTDPANVPRDRWYVVSRGTPGAVVSLTMDSEDTPDVICVVYRTYGVTGVRDGSIRRVYHPSTPTTAVQRVEPIDLTGQYMGTADAETYAANVWQRVSAEAMTANITVKGGLFTVDGAFQPAPLILAGDWIDVVDLPGHAPVFITGTTYSKAEHMVTITTGSSEQRELVIPGLASLPMALSVFGADTSYDTTPEPYSAPADDPYTEPYTETDPESPTVDPSPASDLDPTGGLADWGMDYKPDKPSFKYYTDEWFL